HDPAALWSCRTSSRRHRFAAVSREPTWHLRCCGRPHRAVGRGICSVSGGESSEGRPAVSIVLPVHNDGSYLAGVIESYEPMLERLGRPYELLLVTNACTDDSVAIAMRLGQENANILNVDLEVGGWGRAVRAGLSAARGGTLCYTNLARTSPQVLGLLLA